MSGRHMLVHASFVERENRFVVLARLSDRREVRAYLPNTSRLTDLLVPGARLVLARAEDPRRRTRWTATRVWDGTWVALDAAAAAGSVAAHLDAGARLPGWPAAAAVRREVSRDGHRFDLELDLEDGVSAVVEVKSLSRARVRVAPLSSTPSARGVAHLEALGVLAASGVPAAVVFVVQRGDVDVLDIGLPADPGWIDAVRRAREHGVLVASYACDVEERGLRLGRQLVVRDRG